MPDYFDVLIAGGGPAGLTAAVYAGRAGLSAVVLEQQPVPGGQMAMTPEIENVPGIPRIDGFSLGTQMAEQAKRFGAVIIPSPVTALHLEAGALHTDTPSQTFASKTIILAMGARRRRLSIPGEDTFSGRGVSWCAVCDGHFFRNKPVAVIGGGNTALEDALHMASLGCPVTLIHRRDSFRGSPVLLERVQKQPLIKTMTPYIPVSIEGTAAVTGLTVRHVQTGEISAVDTAAVFECVGTAANTELAAQWLELDDEGRIIAGENTETAIPGVYAAGDLRRKPLYQIVTAAADGAVAASRAAVFVLTGAAGNDILKR